MPALSAMDLQNLLNRRQPRKRPASTLVVDLCSEPEDEVPVKPALSKPQLHPVKLQPALSKPLLFTQSFTLIYIYIYCYHIILSYPIQTYNRDPNFHIRPQYPLPKTTEELSSETQMTRVSVDEILLKFFPHFMIFQGCGPSSC